MICRLLQLFPLSPAQADYELYGFHQRLKMPVFAQRFLCHFCSHFPFNFLLLGGGNIGDAKNPFNYYAFGLFYILRFRIACLIVVNFTFIRSLKGHVNVLGTHIKRNFRILSPNSTNGHEKKNLREFILHEEKNPIQVFFSERQIN